MEHGGVQRGVCAEIRRLGPGGCLHQGAGLSGPGKGSFSDGLGPSCSQMTLFSALKTTPLVLPVAEDIKNVPLKVPC